MTSAVTSKNSTHRVLVVCTVVLVVLLLYLAAWDGLTATAFRNLGPGFFIRAQLHRTDKSTHYTTSDQQRNYGSSSSSSSSNSSSSSSNSNSTKTTTNSSSHKTKDDWFQHPAVFTMQQLGLWRTSFLGVIDPTADAPRQAASLRQASNSIKGKQQQRKSPVAADAVLLQHWWRCQGAGADKLHLRGVGSAYSAVDSTFLMQLLPKHMTDQWSALNLTQITNNRTWKMQQSKLDEGRINAWHVEAVNLSSSSSYSIATSSSSLSKHSYSWDSTRCTSSPAVFRPGSMWTVITQATQYDIKLYARLLMQHTSFHKAIGFTGSILFVSRTTAAALVQQQEVQKGLDGGTIILVLWDDDTVPSMPYYYQYLWYNLVILATWGVPEIKLAMIDLDEFLILPQHLTLTAAFQPGGCLHGYQQVRITRFNAFFGVTAAQVAACHKVPSQVPPQAHGAAGAKELASAAAETERMLINTMNGTCHTCNSSSDTPTAVRTISSAAGVRALMATATSNGSLFAACESLKQHLEPDVRGLTDLGWQQYFRQQQSGQQPVVGYIERYTTTAPSVRWAHKSVVDPNYVAGYAVHEASVMLPGGQDTRAAVPYNCAFGIHLVNMFRHRGMGSREQLQLGLETGATFNLTGHVQLLAQQQTTAMPDATDTH